MIIYKIASHCFNSNLLSINPVSPKCNKLTLTWWNDRRKNRRPGASAWRKARHWRMAPPWAPRGRLPPRICTFSSSSWRPSHWGRDTALWILLCVARESSSKSWRQAETSSLPTRVYGPRRRHCLRPWLRFNGRGWSRPAAACGRFCRLPGTGHFAILRTTGLADEVPRACGKVIPDVQSRKNIDRKRDSETARSHSVSRIARDRDCFPYVASTSRMDRDGREGLCRAISTAGNSFPEEDRLGSECDVADDGFV